MSLQYFENLWSGVEVTSGEDSFYFFGSALGAGVGPVHNTEIIIANLKGLRITKMKIKIN